MHISVKNTINKYLAYDSELTSTHFKTSKQFTAHRTSPCPNKEGNDNSIGPPLSWKGRKTKAEWAREMALKWTAQPSFTSLSPPHFPQPWSAVGRSGRSPPNLGHSRQAGGPKTNSNDSYKKRIENHVDITLQHNKQSHF